MNKNYCESINNSNFLKIENGTVYGLYLIKPNYYPNQ